MMKSLFVLGACAVLPVGLFLRAPAVTSSAAPDAVAYEIDGVHSSIVFRIKHMGVSYTYGRFDKVSGSVTYDEAKPENDKIDVEIAADSIDTNDGGRDTHVKSPDLLSAAEFPTITFKSTKVAKKDKKLSVTGDLTFHGKTKSVVVDVDPVGAADTRMGKRAGFETTFEIKRSEYGCNGLLDGIGDDVRLIVSLECVVPSAKKK